MQMAGIEEHPFNIEIFIPISSFDLGHLIRLCSGDIFLVSDVLDTFCVEGSQRIESLRKAADREDMDAVVCEAVRSAAHFHFCIFSKKTHRLTISACSTDVLYRHLQEPRRSHSCREERGFTQTYSFHCPVHLPCSRTGPPASTLPERGRA